MPGHDQASRIRDILHAELRMLGHEIVDLRAAALMADSTQIVVVAAGDGGVSIVFDGGRYSVAPSSINWALLVSTVSAVATRNRTTQEKST